MKRLSRHTVVVLVVALLACAGGMALSVVAFGQSGSDLDATVPLGDYTGTTPAATAPLSNYTPTTPSTPASTPTASTPPSGGTSTGSSTPASGHRPTGTSGSKGVPASGGPTPSRVTRPGPTHLAFTGGEPLIIGGAGVALMLAGLTLQARRRRLRAQ
jgi:hypothetical protein